MKAVFYIAIIVAALIALSQASAVVNLNDNTFYTFLSENQNKRVFIKFTQEWCTHCKNLAPVWDELAGEVSDGEEVVFASVDCAIAKNTCRSRGVNGYPTLQIFHELKAADFEGPRDKEFLAAYARSAVTTDEVPYELPPLVRELAHDLNEIWAIRRNALGVIVALTFVFGAVFSCLCCASTKVVYKEKKD